MANQEEPKHHPRTVQSVEDAAIKLIRYTDQNGEDVVQFALVGENNVILLDHKELGLGPQRTPMGFATGWLKEGILQLLKPKDPYATVKANTTSTAAPGSI
jgi:hypothetical protein